MNKEQSPNDDLNRRDEAVRRDTATFFVGRDAANADAEVVGAEDIKNLTKKLSYCAVKCARY